MAEDDRDVQIIMLVTLSTIFDRAYSPDKVDTNDVGMLHQLGKRQKGEVGCWEHLDKNFEDDYDLLEDVLESVADCKDDDVKKNIFCITKNLAGRFPDIKYSFFLLIKLGFLMYGMREADYIDNASQFMQPLKQAFLDFFNRLKPTIDARNKRSRVEKDSCDDKADWEDSPAAVAAQKRYEESLKDLSGLSLNHGRGGVSDDTSDNLTEEMDSTSYSL
ncbi:MAG: hypothetical protein GKR77_05585 [Legionellales bacterium]|nr:hypothetical protein [Legionellales bacterium]